MKVNYTLQRVDSKSDSTYGILFDDNMDHKCFIIEDEYREVKVGGETRIPAGTYDVKYREVLSPLTEKYRKKFDWFTWHLELQDVPDFTFTYLHIGNYESSTDGCLLTNTNVSLSDDQWVGGNSTKAFEEVYKEMCKHLDEGNELSITVRDEDYLKQPF